MFTDAMTTGEKLVNGLGLTLLGMGIVFAVLVILSFTLQILEKVAGEKQIKKTTSNKEVETKIEPVPAQEKDDEELIAVIAAAIAASTGSSIEDFMVKSIKPLSQKTTLWGSVGRQQQMIERY